MTAEGDPGWRTPNIVVDEKPDAGLRDAILKPPRNRAGLSARTCDHLLFEAAEGIA
jgi:hypothetical protein